MSLTCDKDSFKAVSFNSQGISLIVGRQTQINKTQQGKTVNGVGKSLLAYLIHFCLGAKKSDELAKKLPNWEFTLKFLLEDEVHVVTRNTTNQTIITVNGNEERVSKYYKEELFPKLIVPNEFIRDFGLTFRPVIKRFIRPDKESYNYFDRVKAEKTEYQVLLYNALLLGLDLNLVNEKYGLRQQQAEHESLKKFWSKSSVFKEYFIQSAHPDIELEALNSRIQKIEQDLKDFKVAENYHDMEQEANATQAALRKSRNKKVILENQILAINNSLEETPDISFEQVNRVYEQANFFFNDQVQKRLNDVLIFHRNLLENRNKRLVGERETRERELRDILRDIESLNGHLNYHIQYLSEHGAIEELEANQQHLNDMKLQAQEITRYQELLEENKRSLQEIQIKMIRQTQHTDSYLVKNKTFVTEAKSLYSSLANKFYPNKANGLSIENNNGENQTRFDIDATIDSDPSDGINSVKIFCYDMTLLQLQRHHNFKFLFHDSRLFDPIENRQRALLFDTAYDIVTQEGYQYIASINEDQIRSMKEVLPDDRYSEIFGDRSVVLNLTDESEQTKLLGVDVDLKY